MNIEIWKVGTMKEYWDSQRDRFEPCARDEITFGIYNTSCIKCNDIVILYPDMSMSSYIAENCQYFEEQDRSSSSLDSI